MQQRQDHHVVTKAQTCDLVFEASQMTARPACKHIRSADVCLLYYSAALCPTGGPVPLLHGLPH